MTFCRPSASQKRLWAKGRSAETHSTTASGRDEASLLKRRAEAAQTPLAELYTQFDAACAALGTARLPELAVNASGRQVAVTPQVAGVKGGKRVIGQIGDPYLDELRDEVLAGKRQLTPGAWKAVFLAGDWVTEEGGSGIRPVD